MKWVQSDQASAKLDVMSVFKLESFFFNQKSQHNSESLLYNMRGNTTVKVQWLIVKLWSD